MMARMKIYGWLLIGLRGKFLLSKICDLSHHPIGAIPINKRLLQWFSKTGMTLLRHPARKPCANVA